MPVRGPSCGQVGSSIGLVCAIASGLCYRIMRLLWLAHDVQIILLQVLVDMVLVRQNADSQQRVQGSKGGEQGTAANASLRVCCRLRRVRSNARSAGGCVRLTGYAKDYRVPQKWEQLSLYRN
jgi:hypothetical protein